MKLPNSTKIRFCNAMDALRTHSINCRDCAIYIRWGEGNVCETGQEIILMEIAYADTTPEFNEETTP